MREIQRLDTRRTEYIELKCRITSAELSELCKQKHFTKEQCVLVTGMAMQILKKAAIHVYYIFIDCNVLTCITLGAAIDDWMDELENKRELSKVFIIECLASLLLMKASQEWKDYIYQHTGRYPGSFQFIEDEGQLNHLEEYLSLFEQEEIKVTSSGMMSPTKSILFETRLMEQKNIETDRNDHNCKTCSLRSDCQFSCER